MRRPDPERSTTPPDGRPLALQPRWRKDFPIHTPEDEYVSRRDLAKFLVLTSLAFVTGQIWIIVLNAFRKMRSAPPVSQIALLSDLTPGKVLVFHYPEEHDNCFLVRTHDDKLLAYSQVCTHLSCAVIPRPDEGLIRCPCHDGVFDMSTGRPLAGPPQRPLPAIQLRVQSGRIYAAGVEQRTV